MSPSPISEPPRPLACAPLTLYSNFCVNKFIKGKKNLDCEVNPLLLPCGSKVAEVLLIFICLYLC